VADLTPGLYHYAAGRHALELLKRGADPQLARRFFPGQAWTGRAAALLFMTAVFPRVQWKYRFPRAYRVVTLDAGHLCQTFCLAATWLGLAPFCTAAFADSRIEQALQIDGINESVIYAAGVGVRPADGHQLASAFMRSMNQGDS
jgi:SagB-type dehydrogenase family enzyme